MQELDMNRIPEHIGIILDGNGRWDAYDIKVLEDYLMKYE